MFNTVFTTDQWQGDDDQFCRDLAALKFKNWVFQCAVEDVIESEVKDAMEQFRNMPMPEPI